MDTLARTLCPDSMDIVIEIAIGDRLTDLVSGIVRTFVETGATIADKQDVVDFAQVFYCHDEIIAGWTKQELAERDLNAGYAKGGQTGSTDAFIPKANRVLQKDVFKAGLLACLATGAFPSKGQWHVDR